MMGYCEKIDPDELNEVSLYRATVEYSYHETEKILVYYFWLDDIDLGDASKLIGDFFDDLMNNNKGRWYILRSIERLDIDGEIYTNLEEFMGEEEE